MDSPWKVDSQVWCLNWQTESIEQLSGRLTLYCNVSLQTRDFLMLEGRVCVCLLGPKQKWYTSQSPPEPQRRVCFLAFPNGFLNSRAHSSLWKVKSHATCETLAASITFLTVLSQDCVIPGIRLIWVIQNNLSIQDL